MSWHKRIMKDKTYPHFSKPRKDNKTGVYRAYVIIGCSRSLHLVGKTKEEVQVRLDDIKFRLDNKKCLYCNINNCNCFE